MQLIVNAFVHIDSTVRGKPCSEPIARNPELYRMLPTVPAWNSAVTTYSVEGRASTAISR